MAKQRGIIKLEGTLEDITFQKTRDGYRAKVRSAISASRINSEINFIRTRENMAEFTTAGKAGKVLRAALEAKLKRTADRYMVSRLVKRMMTILKTDTTNLRGQRTVADGKIELLEGFDFSVNAELGKSLTAPYSATIERSSGECSVSIPPFIPADTVFVPEGTSHFRIFTVAIEIDFREGKYTAVSKESPLLPWDQTNTTAINLAANLGVNSELPLVLAMGIEYMQDLGGIKYPLFDTTLNAMKLVKVSVE